LAWGFDLASRQWTAGPPHSAGTWQLMAPLAFEALEEVCAPLARVKSIDGERLVLRLRGGMIPARNPRRQSVVPGTVFRLVEVGGAGDSAAPQPRYATVARVDGHLLEVRVAGELPAGRFGAHDARWLAVGVPQLHGATRYAMQLQTSEPGRPLVGGEIWSGGRREAPETYEGVTDERGEVRITPRAGGVVWLQVRLGAVLLDAIPVVPGSGDAVTLPTHVSPARIRAAEALALSHDDMAELAAFRSLCVARIKAREAAGQTAEAEALRDECRRTLEERAANLHQRLQARKVAAASEASAEVAGAAAAWQALASDLDKLRASLTPSPPK
jgi:hypothetical protein